MQERDPRDLRRQRGRRRWEREERPLAELPGTSGLPHLSLTGRDGHTDVERNLRGVQSLSQGRPVGVRARTQTQVS